VSLDRPPLSHSTTSYLRDVPKTGCFLSSSFVPSCNTHSHHNIHTQEMIDKEQLCTVDSMMYSKNREIYMYMYRFAKKKNAIWERRVGSVCVLGMQKERKKLQRKGNKQKKRVTRGQRTVALLVGRHKTSHHLQCTSGSCLASLFFQGFKRFTELHFFTQVFACGTSCCRIPERDPLGNQHLSARVRCIRQFQMTDHRILACKSSRAHNAHMRLLRHMAVHMAVAIMDPCKRLGTLFTRVRSVDIVRQPMRLEVIGPAKRAIASWEIADIPLLPLATIVAARHLGRD